MTTISAQDVKTLRERTGAGMSDCKKALVEVSGDMEAAIDWLRKKGLAAAAKKAGRVAAEGLVGVASSGNAGAVVEVNSETDFVARNEMFQQFVRQVSEAALQANDIEALKTASVGSENVNDKLTNLIATIGEHMSLRRMQKIEVSQGIVANYVHSAVAPQLGKIGVLVGLESTGDTAKLQELGRKIAMHIAAAKPEAANIASLDPALVQRERDVLTDQARQSGKPEAVIEKMIEGRIRKYYEESVLEEQLFVITGEGTVRDAVEQLSKEIGAPIKITEFVRYALGEGIEKQETDFAAEVAAMAG